MNYFAAILTLVLAASAAVAQALGPGAAEVDEVRALVARYNEARDSRDPAAIAALFTADADQLVSSGEWRRGREEMLAGMQRSSEANPGDRTLTVESVRFLDADVALADARYEIAGAAGGEPRRMWSTFVAVRTAEGWRLAAIRNMLPSR